jgi:hypothetical protein
MMLVAGVVAVGWGNVPITLASGSMFISASPDMIVHDAWIKAPIGLLAVPVFLLGLTLAVIPFREGQ